MSASAIQRGLYWLAGQLSFSRIEVPGPVHAAGPVLYLGLHRNGALDGVAYMKALPGVTCLVSAQLHRSALGRWVFPGIAVARDKDRRRGILADNGDSMERCVRHLIGGASLLVLPEGSSSLGARHLPFKPGAARIAHQVLARGQTLTVVPLAIHYECAWEWQSRVEIVAGAPLLLRPEEARGIDALHDLFTRALEAVGINVDSDQELGFIEQLAYGATLGSALSYGACLKHFERGVPEQLRRQAAQLSASAGHARAWTHQGIPLMPVGSALPYALAWLVLAPPVLLFMGANFGPILAAYAASRILPDERNVVAFWRAMVALPATVLWLAAVLPTLWIWHGPSVALAYIGVSVLGLKLYYRVRKLSVAVFNSVCAPSLKKPLLAFRSSLLKSLGHG